MSLPATYENLLPYLQDLELTRPGSPCGMVFYYSMNTECYTCPFSNGPGTDCNLHGTNPTLIQTLAEIRLKHPELYI